MNKENKKNTDKMFKVLFIVIDLISIPVNLLTRLLIVSASIGFMRSQGAEMSTLWIVIGLIYVFLPLFEMYRGDE